jgi:hypothetical protein
MNRARLPPPEYLIKPDAYTACMLHELTRRLFQHDLSLFYQPELTALVEFSVLGAVSPGSLGDSAANTVFLHLHARAIRHPARS